MSSLRNAVKRVTHKERGQLQKRSHLGLLEKKTDYKKRSEHYHKREDRIKFLQTKVSMKNPDEFYFGMNKSYINDNGQHKKLKNIEQIELNEKIGNDTLRIMKDQDLHYIRLQKQKDIKKIEKLQSTLHYIEVDNNTQNKKRKHTIFVNTKTELDTFNPAKHFDTVPELMNRSFNRPRLETLKKFAMKQIGYKINDNNDQDDNDDNNNNLDVENNSTSIIITKNQLEKNSKVQEKLMQTISKERNNAYSEMKERMKRVDKIKRAEAHLITEKLLRTQKGRKRKILSAENGNPAIYKWRRKRLA